MDTSLHEQYKKATQRKVTAPSGFTFTLRGLTPAESLDALKGVPSMIDPKEVSIPAEGPPAEKKDESDPMGRIQTLIRQAENTNLSNRKMITMVVEEVTEDGANNTLPYDTLGLADVNFLVEQINIASGFASPEAGEARRLVQES